MTITVNQQEWGALTADQQSLIASIISENFAGETIEPASSGVSATAEVGGICQTGCDIAQAAAIEARMGSSWAGRVHPAVSRSRLTSGTSALPVASMM